MKYCQVCGKPRTELHHIVFRSEASYMANVSINFKYLCENCHRGKNGPHMNSDVDLKYKREMQNELFYIFDHKQYFNEEEIKKKLDISASEFIRMFKGLKRYKEGYLREDIVKLCMGGTLYMDDTEKELLDLMRQVSVV